MKIRDWPDGRLVVWAPAKVNLFLEVLGKRADGYHDLETVMVAVSLYDTLVFQEDATGEITFRCDDAAIPQGMTNLVVRSALLLQRETGSQRCGARIWMRKRIPAAAGLGGGSSDAAATLVALSTLWKLGLSLSDLERLGAQIGSDVPFFFHTPAAVGRGRGEQLTPLSLARPLYLVLVCPQEGVSTAEVYRRLGPSDIRHPIQPMLDSLARGDGRVGSLLFNRLEATAVPLCPAISSSLELLRAVGLGGSRMTGSGSASFGLATGRSGAVRAARSIRDRFPGRVFVVRTTT
jgi:4-diphosphocytidyl-2-C-methyl-D-erythritol kinase